MRNPRLFSDHFNIERSALTSEGLLNPILNADTRLFIDPVLLGASSNLILQSSGSLQFRTYFESIIKLLGVSKNEGDVPFRNAKRLLKLGERSELCLGYGSGPRGRQTSRDIAAQILRTAKEIVDLGVRDPELFSLMGLLEEGVGPDTIGDMTATAIEPALAEITEMFCRENEVDTLEVVVLDSRRWLPQNPYTGTAIYLTPLDVLRDLPVAKDWDDVSRVASENARIRAEINKYIGDIWKASRREQKRRVREHALTSKGAFRAVLDAVYLLREDSYDFEADVDGHDLFRAALAEIAPRFPLYISPVSSPTEKELQRVVGEIIAHFRQLVEKNGINELLWHNGVPRKERAAQKLFFAVADVYCRANNIDVSPEADSGGGPVDFKFSSGYVHRVLVEIKLSTGQVVHGFQRQLTVYEEAEKSFSSTLLVLDVGKMGRKLETVLQLKNMAAKQGLRTPDVEVVDATLKPSASRRE